MLGGDVRASGYDDHHRHASPAAPSSLPARVPNRPRTCDHGGVNIVEPTTLSLHGRALSYVKAGSGPALLLIHGMAGTHETWQAVIEPLAERHTVIAVDLPGHGASEAGAGDYSLGSLAAGLRDLLVKLGQERATLVGHSLGGGI